MKHIWKGLRSRACSPRHICLASKTGDAEAHSLFFVEWSQPWQTHRSIVLPQDAAKYKYDQVSKEAACRCQNIDSPVARQISREGAFSICGYINDFFSTLSRAARSTACCKGGRWCGGRKDSTLLRWVGSFWWLISDALLWSRYVWPY